MQSKTRKPSKTRPKILVLVGPTASGKSALAVKLAKKLDGEIVSADSRQVYRGLDIGSGKVTKREMAGVPHHILSFVNPKRVYTVSDYKRDAERVIDDILSRGKLPIIVGGTGHYVDAVSKGLVVPEVAPNAKLRVRLAKLSTGQMFKLLKALDPARAKQIDPNNPRRLVRAIEIATALGKVPKLKSNPRYSPIVIGINPGQEKLRKNIHKRLLQRIKSGMIAEVKTLRASGLSWKRLYDLGLEYRYISLYLRGTITKAQMLVQLENEINHYAKRQMTWFKADSQITWINPNPSLFLRIRSLLRAISP